MKKDKKINKSEQIPKNLLGFFWYFIKPYKAMVIAAVVCSLISGVIDGFLLPYFIRDLIKTATDNYANRANVFEFLLFGLVLYVAFCIINSMLIAVDNLLDKRFQPKILANINIKLLQHVHKHSYKYFSDNFGGSLANKISDVSNTFFNIINIIVFKFIPAVIMLTINVVFFTKINIYLGALMLIWMFSHFLYTMVRFKSMSKSSKEYSEENSVVKGKVIDSLTNFSIIKLNSKQDKETKLISKAYDKEVKLAVKNWTEFQKTGIPLDALSELFRIAIVFCMFYLYSKSKLEIADIAYVMMVLGTIYRSVWLINNSLLDFIKDISKVQKSLDTLLVPYEVEDAPKAKKLQVQEGSIKLDNISFHYGNRKNVFKDFSLDIKPGEKVGLVGSSGAGKTTLVNLLLRLFDVQKGSVQIDGQNVAKVTQKSLRENISVVTQDSTLFHRTLEENIGYTKEKATQKEIISASKKADAHKFINELPKKYKTLVGERGIKLSGGQRQRVNIARTILKDAPILVLDEATSALDSETEVYIQKTFKEIMKGKTTIAIAHRLSTLKLMDRIVVVDQGKIVEEGTHKELLKKNGTYAKLWKLQSTDFISE